MGWKLGRGLCLLFVARAEAYLHAKFHLDPSNRLATVHERHRQDRQRSDIIGRTVLQMVAQKTVHLIPMLCSLSVLCVCDVDVLWPNGWMDQNATWYRRRPWPRRQCKMETQLLPPKGAQQPPIFGPCLLWPDGWMDQDATWYEGRPWPGDIVLHGDPSSRLYLPRKGHSSSSLFGLCLLCHCFTALSMTCWPRCSQRVIDNTVKQSCKRLHACVAANGGHVELNTCCECPTTFAVSAEFCCHINWCSALNKSCFVFVHMIIFSRFVITILAKNS